MPVGFSDEVGRFVVFARGGRETMREEATGIDQLVEEAAVRPMSRLAFITRALALGLSTSAVATILGDIEGPATSLAASKSAKISFSSWGEPSEQDTIHKVLDVFH